MPCRQPGQEGFYLALLALLAAAFWLWMIADCFHRRPPRWAWRVIVVVLPVAGAVAYGLKEAFSGRLRPVLLRAPWPFHYMYMLAQKGFLNF